MTRMFLPVLCALGLGLAVPQPLRAQENGRGLMERGLELFLDGLGQEIDPALRDLRDLGIRLGPALQDFMTEMGPALADILAAVPDISAYDPPEMLPNGDIILRRRQPLPEGAPDPGPDQAGSGQDIEI